MVALVGAVSLEKTLEPPVVVVLVVLSLLVVAVNGLLAFDSSFPGVSILCLDFYS